MRRIEFVTEGTHYSMLQFFSIGIKIQNDFPKVIYTINPILNIFTDLSNKSPQNTGKWDIVLKPQLKSRKIEPLTFPKLK